MEPRNNTSCHHDPQSETPPMTPNRRTIAKCDTSWGEYRRRRGGGLFLCAPQGLVAPSVSLPMVGCHLPQEGRKRATHSQVSQLSAIVHLRGEYRPQGGEAASRATECWKRRVPRSQVEASYRLLVAGCQADSEPNNWKRAWQASQLTPTRLLRPPVPRSLRPPRPSARGSS
jgi:hypothetical protein